MKKVTLLFDGPYKDCWVRAWKEKREFIVQVWKSGKAEGDPDGDWAMPGIIGLPASIDQAVLQT